MQLALALLQRTAEEATQMADLVFMAVTVAFFAIAWAYVRGCDRL